MLYTYVTITIRSIVSSLILRSTGLDPDYMRKLSCRHRHGKLFRRTSTRRSKCVGDFCCCSLKLIRIFYPNSFLSLDIQNGFWRILWKELGRALSSWNILEDKSCRFETCTYSLFGFIRTTNLRKIWLYYFVA